MALVPYSDGPALVRADLGSGLADFGYTENGVDVSRELYKLLVYGDQNGGTDGAPIDIQYLSGIWRIRTTFTKWDVTKSDLIASGVKGVAAGTDPTHGTFMFSGSNSVRLLIHTTARPLNFLQVVYLDSFEINKGVKHSKLVVDWEAHVNSSSLFFNAVTA